MAGGDGRGVGGGDGGVDGVGVLEVDTLGAEAEEGGHVCGSDGASAEAVGYKDDDVVARLRGGSLLGDGGQGGEKREGSEAAQGDLCDEHVKSMVAGCERQVNGRGGVRWPVAFSR